MKKKNRFLANKTFVVFSILAVCIILTAVFAPVVTKVLFAKNLFFFFIILLL